jgi:peptidylprolyl isomerase
MILLAAVFTTGCGGPAAAQTGDAVKVNYTGRIADGTVFDSSVGGEPYEFTLGQGQVIPGFDQAVIGMKVGESKTVTISFDKAYGPRRDDLIAEVGRDQLPPEIDPQVGMQLQGSQGVVTIVGVSETTVTIDANPPLAGQDLTFDIELVEIGASEQSTTSSDLTALPLPQALTNGKLTLAEFGRGTCIPCKQMKPILEKMALDYQDRMNVCIISIDEYRDLTNSYNIMAIPTQIGFDSSGKEIFRHVGFWSEEEIVAQLKKSGIE